MSGFIESHPVDPIRPLGGPVLIYLALLAQPDTICNFCSYMNWLTKIPNPPNIYLRNVSALPYLCCRRHAASCTTSQFRALRCCHCCLHSPSSLCQDQAQGSVYVLLLPPVWLGSPPHRRRTTPCLVVLAETPRQSSYSPCPSAAPPQCPLHQHRPGSIAQTGSWWALVSWTMIVWHK